MRKEVLREVWRVVRDRKLEEMQKDKKHKKKSDKIDRLKYLPDSVKEEYIEDFYNLAKFTFKMNGLNLIGGQNPSMTLISKRDALKNKIKSLEKKLGFKMKGGIVNAKEGTKSPEKDKKARGKGDHKDEKH